MKQIDWYPDEAEMERHMATCPNASPWCFYEYEPRCEVCSCSTTERMKENLNELVPMFEHPDGYIICKFCKNDGDYKKMAKDETCYPKELIGDWIDKKCPRCGAQLLANKKKQEWCSFVECEYGLDDEDDLK